MSRTATVAALTCVSAASLLVSARRRFGALVVVGRSMEPALHAGDRLVYRRGARGLATGVVVVLDAATLPGWLPVPGDPARMVKRVVAVGGDPRPDDVPGTGSHVPPGHVVVRGDNVRSIDSRTWGALPESAVVGIVLNGSTAVGRLVGGGAPDRG